MNLISYHGVQISNSTFGDSNGAALKIIGTTSNKPILELANATTTYATVYNNGNFQLQNGGTFTDAGYRLDVNGTARIQNQLTLTGAVSGVGNLSSYTVTAATGSAISKQITSTLVAAANSDVLVGLDINPTFTNGIFTGVSNFALRVRGTTNTNFFSSGNIGINTSTDSGFKIDVNGTARVQGNITQSSLGYFYNNGNSVSLRSNLAGGSGYVVDGQSFNNLTASNIEQGLANFSGTYAPTSTSGTPSFNALKLNFTINQTGAANGITRGLFIQPTITAAADFRAIEISNGITILGASTTAKASLRMPSGTAPTSPVNGDIWYDGTDIKMRIGAVTKTFTLL